MISSWLLELFANTACTIHIHCPIVLIKLQQQNFWSNIHGGFRAGFRPISYAANSYTASPRPRKNRVRPWHDRERRNGVTAIWRPTVSSEPGACNNKSVNVKIYTFLPRLRLRLFYVNIHLFLIMSLHLQIALSVS